MSGEELRTLAEAATPGEWVAYQEHGRDMTDEGWSEIGVQTIGVTIAFTHAMGWEDNDLAAEDSAFIAAANPTAVLALLDERDALRAQVKRVNQVRRWVVPNGYAGGPEGDKTTAVMVRLDELRAALKGPA